MTLRLESKRLGHVQMRQHNKKAALFITCCLPFSIFFFLVIVGLKGTDIPKSFFYGVRPYLFIGSALFLILGFTRYWLEVKKGWKGFKLLAIGGWISGLVLFDIGMSIGRVQVRDISLLIISGVVILGSIWLQWKSIREREREI